MNICIYGASSERIDRSFTDKGEILGESIARNGDVVVFGGGATGMMGAVARGASRAGGEIIGIVPRFFDVDGVLFDKCTELIYTDTMSERKSLLEEKADAFLVTPGGIGTLDEFFETLTLRQLCAHEKPIAIYNINGYFDDTVRMLETAIKYDFLSAINRSLYFVSDDADKIMEYFNSYSTDNTPPARFRGAK